MTAATRTTARRPPTGPQQDAFTVDAERHRRELHVHCYRMLASYDDAEDALQETMLRAWRARESFAGGNLRAWLYRIATNVCLDLQRGRRRRAPSTSYAEIPWLQPYPDTLLDELADAEPPPDQRLVARETVELVFLAALQMLPPRQRAALLAREVLDLSAAETADLLGTSVAAANSAVQRARATMRRHLPAHRTDWAVREPSPEESRLLSTFIEAHERYDREAALAAVTADVRVTMPPYPMLFEGRDGLRPLLERAFGPDRDGDWRLLPTSVNRMPAAASYLRRAGDTVFRPFKLDVLQVESAAIAEITTFGPELFGALGLPATLAGGSAR